MNKQNNMKGRQRGRIGGKPRPQGGRNPNYDGGGGNNNRMRGNAQQLMDKYLLMARDATSAGDRVLAENYFQHADHYYRVVNARLEQQQGQGNRRYQNDDRNGQNHNQGQNNGQGNGQDTRSEQHARSGSSIDTSNTGEGSSESSQTQNTQARDSDTPVESQSSSPSNADIGLPPGIFGSTPSAAPDENKASEGGEEASSKPARARTPVRRRRTRSDKPAASANAND